MVPVNLLPRLRSSQHSTVCACSKRTDKAEKHKPWSERKDTVVQKKLSLKLDLAPTSEKSNLSLSWGELAATADCPSVVAVVALPFGTSCVCNVFSIASDRSLLCSLIWFCAMASSSKTVSRTYKNNYSRITIEEEKYLVGPIAHIFSFRYSVFINFSLSLADFGCEACE